jgi:hypothetical protein
MTQVSRDVTLCWVCGSWHSEGLWCLHVQGSNSARTNMHYIGQVELQSCASSWTASPRRWRQYVWYEHENLFFLCFVDPASLYNLVNKAKLVHNFHSTVHTSHPYRKTSTKCRINTVASPNDGHIVSRNMYRKEINILRKSFIPPCIPDSHPYRITSTKCHINTVTSPDDGHIVARNM